MKKVILIHIVLAGLMMLIGCATQTDVNTIDNRLTEMEMRDIQQRETGNSSNLSLKLTARN